MVTHRRLLRQTSSLFELYAFLLSGLLCGARMPTATSYSGGCICGCTIAMV